jgi:hypothetical protein
MRPAGREPVWAGQYTHTIDIGSAKFYRAPWAG